MAGMDYLKCGGCGERIFADGDWILRDSIDGDLYCHSCVKKLKKKIETLKKHDRRKH